MATPATSAAAREAAEPGEAWPAALAWWRPAPLESLLAELVVYRALVAVAQHLKRFRNLRARVSDIILRRQNDRTHLLELLRGLFRPAVSVWMPF